MPSDGQVLTWISDFETEGSTRLPARPSYLVCADGLNDGAWSEALRGVGARCD